MYITPSIDRILKESRKYRYYLTFAQQVLGDGMSPDLRHIVLSNTALKITGRNAIHTRNIIEKETGVSVKEQDKLELGEFYIYKQKLVGQSISIRVKFPSYLVKKDKVNNRRYMSDEDWAIIEKEQLSKYYRKLPKGPNAHKAIYPKSMVASKSQENGDVENLKDTVDIREKESGNGDKQGACQGTDQGSNQISPSDGTVNSRVASILTPEKGNEEGILGDTLPKEETQYIRRTPRNIDF